MSQQKPRGRSVQNSATKKSSITTFYWAIAAVALIAVVVVGYNSLGGGSVEGTGINGVIPAKRSSSLPVGVDADGRYFVGQADAPVTVIEYADFQCPGCGYYATTVSSGFESAYVATGQVKKVFHDFPLQSHPNAIGAAVAARCAGEQSGAEGFWQMHDVIYANQRQWSALNSGNFTKQLITYATQIELDTEAFNSCLNDDAVKSVVLDHQKQSNQLGLPGTPSFAVNGTVVDASSAQSIEDIDALVRQAVDALLQ
jgi:protein-disulfide isomerase